MSFNVKKGLFDFKNPICTASGTFGYGEEFDDFFDVSSLGAITIKGTTLNIKDGNPPPRIYETPAGIMNSVGLANIGINAAVKKYSKFFEKIKKNGTKIIINLNAGSINDFKDIVEVANSYDIFDYYEINVSCPNVKKGGDSFSKSPELVKELINDIKPIANKPIITKLSPNVSDIKEYAKAAIEAGTDAISLINTLKGLAVDIKKRKPFFHNKVAGVSGPAIKPIALYMVYQVKELLHEMDIDIPILGMGGIMDYKDALEFLIAGADIVCIGTANFVNPKSSYNILNNLQKYLIENNLKLSDLSF